MLLEPVLTPTANRIVRRQQQFGVLLMFIQGENMQASNV